MNAVEWFHSITPTYRFAFAMNAFLICRTLIILLGYDRMYYFVLCVVKGRYSQTVLDSSQRLMLVDRDLKAAKRMRIVNELAMLKLARDALRDEMVAGVTIRKVLGRIKPGMVEKEQMILLPFEAVP